MKKVFIFREQKEIHFTSLFKNALSLYDKIIIPHEDSEEIQNSFKGITETLGEKMEFVWNILIRDRNDIKTKKRRLTNKNQTNIFVCFWGWGDKDIQSLYEDVYKFAKNFNKGYHFYIAIWQLVKNWVNLISKENITIVRDIYPISEYFKEFDFAKSSAGYNTVHELLNFWIPSIFIPLERWKDDQYKRVKDYENKWLCLQAKSISEIFKEKMIGKLEHLPIKENLQNFKSDNKAKYSAELILDL